MEVVMNTRRKHASIRVSDRDWAREDLNKHLLHEMVHPVFERIRDEHRKQMRALDTEREAEYSERITDEIEVAVDHITNVLYDLISRPS